MTDEGQRDLFGELIEPVRQARVAKEPHERKAATMSQLRALAAACRSCGRSIVWATSVSKRSGKVSRMPVDIDPDPHGNVHLTPEGMGLRAHVLTKVQIAETSASLHVAHHVTCPQGSEWRSKR